MNSPKKIIHKVSSLKEKREDIFICSYLHGWQDFFC